MQGVTEHSHISHKIYVYWKCIFEITHGIQATQKSKLWEYVQIYLKTSSSSIYLKASSAQVSR